MIMILTVKPPRGHLMPKKNSYTIDGVEYPRVTTITGLLDKSGGLVPWAVDCMEKELVENYDPMVSLPEQVNNAKYAYKRVSNEAKDIGSEVHAIIERYIKAKLCGFSFDIQGSKPKVENAYLAFLEWEKHNVKKWLESELTVCDTLNCYAGTLDAVALLNNGFTYCIDFKASNGFYDGYDMQAVAYDHAYDSDDRHVGVLRLDKKTGFPEWKDYTNRYNQAYRGFMYLLDFYYAYKKRRLKNNMRVIK
jgi:hypothetical protein